MRLAQSDGCWNDLSRVAPPRDRVLAFRDAVTGDEWLGMNRTDSPDGRRATAWSFIR
jgi:hypothetical protein